MPSVVHNLAFSRDGSRLAAALGGNGLRIYARERGWAEVARDAGYGLRWEHVDRDANIDAARAAADGDLAPLRALLGPVVERVRQRR